MKYNEVFKNIDSNYQLGLKITLKDLKLLKEIYYNASIKNSDTPTLTLYLMSINHHHIPKNLYICLSEVQTFNYYLELKQKNVEFEMDLKNIIRCRRLANEALDHFDRLFFLGLDYNKVKEDIFFNAGVSQLDTFIVNSLEEIMEGFLNGELGEEDIEILKKYNTDIGKLYEACFPLFQKYGENCQRYYGFPNEFLYYFSTCFRGLSTAYLINIDRYNHNPLLVSEAIEKIYNNEILPKNDLYNRVEKDKSNNEAKKVLDSLKNKVYNIDVNESKKEKNMSTHLNSNNRDMELLIFTLNNIIESREYTMIKKSIDKDSALECRNLDTKTTKTVEFESLDEENFWEFIYAGIATVVPDSIVSFITANPFGDDELSGVVIQLNKRVKVLVTNIDHKYDNWISKLQSDMEDCEDVSKNAYVLSKRMNPEKK